jgi:exodeoxyribonuclease VII small subunit
LLRFKAAKDHNFMSKKTQPPSFEQAIAELEAIVTRMESGQLPLEQSLDAYKQGTELLQYCQKTLAEAEQQVRILNETNTLQPYTNTDD